MTSTEATPDAPPPRETPAEFDPNRPFTTRDGSFVTNFRNDNVSPDRAWAGLVDGLIRSWDKPSGRHLFRELDLVNIPDAPPPPVSTVVSAPARPEAAGDPVAVSEDQAVAAACAVAASVDEKALPEAAMRSWGYYEGIPVAKWESTKLRHAYMTGFLASDAAARARRPSDAGSTGGEATHARPEAWSRDMDAAPRDGTKVLLYVVEAAGSDYATLVGEPEGWQHINIGYFENGKWAHEHSGKPVVGMPLPAPPAAGAARPEADAPVAKAGEDDAGGWRVGSHYAIHVYAGDRPVATFMSPDDARRAVNAVNCAASPGACAGPVMEAQVEAALAAFDKHGGFARQRMRLALEAARAATATPAPGQTDGRQES